MCLAPVHQNDTSVHLFVYNLCILAQVGPLHLPMTNIKHNIFISDLYTLSTWKQVIIVIKLCVIYVYRNFCLSVTHTAFPKYCSV